MYIQEIESGKRVNAPIITKRPTEGCRNECSVPKIERGEKKKRFQRGYSQKKVIVIHICL